MITSVSFRGLCLLSNESSSTTECVPLCETMGLDNCICDDEEECMVCCSGVGRDCSPIDGEPLVDGSLCRGDEGICRSVSVCMCVLWLYSPVDMHVGGVYRQSSGHHCQSMDHHSEPRYQCFQYVPLCCSCVVMHILFLEVFLDENIVLFTLLFSIPIWCLWSCLLHWLVSSHATCY